MFMISEIRLRMLLRISRIENEAPFMLYKASFLFEVFDTLITVIFVLGWGNIVLMMALRMILKEYDEDSTLNGAGDFKMLVESAIRDPKMEIV